MATTDRPADHARTSPSPSTSPSTSTAFPHRQGDHAPNLATLDQLRASGRNALLSPRHRRRARPAGCTTC